MAWENFFKTDESGRTFSTEAQLAAFKTHFPERVVAANPAIDRPLILILDRPTKLIRAKTGDAYDHQAARFRDIKGWPPSLSLSRFGHLPRPGDGEIVDARVVPPERKGDSSTLVIKAEFQDQPAACAIVNYPTMLLECLALTLNEHKGATLRSLNDQAILGPEG